MTKVLILLAAVVALAVTGGFAEERGARSEQIAAPDFKSGGGTWTFRSVHKTLSGGYRSDLISGDFEITIRNGGRQIVQLGGGSAMAYEDAYRIEAMLPAKLTRLDIAPYYQFPFWVGKEWVGNQLTLPDRKWRQVHSEVTRVETVATPAGSFQAYRIERSVILLVRAINYYDNEVYYYSPATRSVVKYEYRRNMKDLVGDPVYSPLESIQIELTGFRADD